MTTDPWLVRAAAAQWMQRVQALPPPSRVSLAAACVERVLPRYTRWALRHDAEGAERAHEMLDALWAASQASPTLPQTLRETLARHRATVERAAVTEPVSNELNWGGVVQAMSALNLAMMSYGEEHPPRHLMSCCYDAFWAGAREIPVDLLGKNWVGQKAQSDAIVAASSAAQTELAFQEQVLAEIERSCRPIAREQARALSKRMGDPGYASAELLDVVAPASTPAVRPKPTADPGRSDGALVDWISRMVNTAFPGLRELFDVLGRQSDTLTGEERDRAIIEWGRADPARKEELTREVHRIMALNLTEEDLAIAISFGLGYHLEGTARTMPSGWLADLIRLLGYT